MTRRELIALLGSTTALSWPRAVWGQQGKLPTIGFLGANTPSTQSQWTTSFVQRLRELGWIERTNVAIEYRWADGRTERFAEIAAELVRLKVDVIVAAGAAAAVAKQATSIIPIVFPIASDPVASGLVSSLARPGGNVTGLSIQHRDLAGKRLEFLREVLPGLRRLAIMGNADYAAAVLEISEAQAAARVLGFEVVTVEIRRADDIPKAIEPLKGRADALYVCGDALVTTNRVRINALALDGRLPTIHGTGEYVEAGGLMSYGANFPELWRRAAELVDKILRGTKPADIPVEQPTKYELAINLKIANALGVTVPPTLLARADKVIE